MAFPDSNAVAWRTKPVGRDEYSLAGSFQILPGGRQQLNVLLGRSADGFVSVAFVAGYGVTVFEYHAQKDEAWERLGDIKIDGVELSRWVPFRVDVRDGHLEVTIGDRSVLTVALLWPAGEWCVGVGRAGGLCRTMARHQAGPLITRGANCPWLPNRAGRPACIQVRW